MVFGIFLSFFVLTFFLPAAAHAYVPFGEVTLEPAWTATFIALALLAIAAGVITTVRRHKNIEKSLRMSEAKFSRTFRSSPDWIAILRLSDGRYIDVNDAFIKMSGYDREEVIGHTAMEIGIYANPEERDQLNDAMLRDGGIANQLIHFRMKSGEVRIVQRSAEIIEIDGESCVISIVRDITSQRETEAALRESERRFREMLETLNLISITVDRNGRLTFCNEYFLRLTGWRREEVIGLNWFDNFVPRQERSRAKDTFLGHIEIGEFPPHNDRELVTRSGDKIMISWSNTVLRDPQGYVVGAAAIGEDITARKKLEDQLRQAQKMEAVGQLAGGVAHDFNNILTATIGYSHLLLSKLRKDDPARFYAEQIQASFDKAASLTQSLLAFSRKQILNPQAMNVNDVVIKIEKLLARLLSEEIELSTELSDRNLTVMADSGQIEQVLMNLATNAKDAMPSGGFLSIKTDIVEIGKKFLDAHGSGRPGFYALISVSDNGTGMDEYTRQRLFEPFFTTKELGKGTGLGLSIVYGIIKQHEGFIDVYSAPGEGTTFKIYLPLIGTVVEEVNNHDASIVPQGGSETILVIEDNEEVRNLIRYVLEEYGYRVIEAVDGLDGINKFREHKDSVDILVIDVIMPRKSGKEVYDEIRQIKPDVKALFTSGYTADIISKKGIIEKGLEFVKKPLSPPELLCKLREVLDRN